MAPGTTTTIGTNTNFISYTSNLEDDCTSTSSTSTERQKSYYEMFVDTYMQGKGIKQTQKTKRKKRVKPASYRKKK